MNITQYTHLINKPDAINERLNNSLEKIIEEFPYFQSARTLRLKHLYNQNSFKYNYALKVTAAHTTEREILFDFITSKQFKTIQNGIYEKKLAEINNIIVVESQIVEPNNQYFNKKEKSILETIEQANLSPVEQNLEIGKPLQFEQNETHSFQEWLQIARLNPIIRTNTTPKTKQNLEKNLVKKLDIIDKFIELNPKIPPISKTASTTPKETIIEDTSNLMTETLAKVYLEQKKYDRAIQAYQILILKYPEKSSFFANKIENIKNLQQNNNFKQ